MEGVKLRGAMIKTFAADKHTRKFFETGEVEAVASGSVKKSHTKVGIRGSGKNP